MNHEREQPGEGRKRERQQTQADPAPQRGADQLPVNQGKREVPFDNRVVGHLRDERDSGDAVGRN